MFNPLQKQNKFASEQSIKISHVTVFLDPKKMALPVPQIVDGQFEYHQEKNNWQQPPIPHWVHVHLRKQKLHSIDFSGWHWHKQKQHFKNSVPDLLTGWGERPRRWSKGNTLERTRTLQLRKRGRPVQYPNHKCDESESRVFPRDNPVDAFCRTSNWLDVFSCKSKQEDCRADYFLKQAELQRKAPQKRGK